MKSASVAAAAAVLVGMSSAQPHGHHGHQHLHAKRDLVTEWETVWETVTVLVDESTTETIYPTHTGSGAPGEFFEPRSSTTSTPEPQPTVAETTSISTQAPPPPPTTTAVTTSSSSSPPPPPAPTTTSTPEPEPAPAPATTSVKTSAAPAQTSSSASGSTYAGSDKFGTSSLDSEKYSGDITYYTLGLGACGYDDAGVDTTKNIVALSHLDWYSRGSGTSLGIDMPNHPWCDQTITISANGKSTTALVHDICPGCVSGSIDVSEAVFMELYGSLGAGRETASWSFN
ncbi:hypothetical protein E0Z10_g6528 [Xylaria hypoxylon]|uniref:RlpA-like protein double-psi beta-barrel domain-containing protein n=1 Tax=Xylaria hypoxylon TaxID=37992 RepID=A0A4Z0YT31_9PEZI|nr:hypothetical protein E0Z10_g6528 [Xylaria hypoxylon]